MDWILGGQEMNLEFLPLPLYVIFCLFMSGGMIYFAISRRKIDRKGLIIAYIILSFVPPFMIMSRIFPQFYNQFIYTLYSIILIFFIEVTVTGIIDLKKGVVNKRVVLGLFLIWPCVIFIILILLHII